MDRSRRALDARTAGRRSVRTRIRTPEAPKQRASSRSSPCGCRPSTRRLLRWPPPRTRERRYPRAQSHIGGLVDSSGFKGAPSVIRPASRTTAPAARHRWVTRASSVFRPERERHLPDLADREPLEPPAPVGLRRRRPFLAVRHDRRTGSRPLSSRDRLPCGARGFTPPPAIAGLDALDA